MQNIYQSVAMFHFSLMRTELHIQKLFSTVFVFREKDDISETDIKANMRKIFIKRMLEQGQNVLNNTLYHTVRSTKVTILGILNKIYIFFKKNI